MPTPTNAELLRKAANILKNRGHAKNVLEDSKGRVCLLGALYCAAHGGPLAYGNGRGDRLLDRVGEYLGRKLRKSRPLSAFEAIDWNNDPKRKIDDVVAALRGTAKAAAR